MPQMNQSELAKLVLVSGRFGNLYHFNILKIVLVITLNFLSMTFFFSFSILSHVLQLHKISLKKIII